MEGGWRGWSSYVLAIVCEPWWCFWLVVVHVCCGSWVRVKGTHHHFGDHDSGGLCCWVLTTTSGQWRMVGSHHGCRRLCPLMGAGCHLWTVAAGFGHLWLRKGGHF